jgi:RNA polymerase sigma factor (TIGR02999 family)
MDDPSQRRLAMGVDNTRSADELIPLVYQQLRQLAQAKLNDERPGQTLTATALVHEAYARLTGKSYPKDWQNEDHFFLAAAEAMRRILIENARRKKRIKRGGDLRRVNLESSLALEADDCDDLLALDEALQQFTLVEPVASQVVQLRYFAGLTIEQSARAMSISVRTANRHWAYAKAWLYKRLK